MFTIVIICLIIFTFCVVSLCFEFFNKDWIIVTIVIVGFISGVTSVVLTAIFGTKNLREKPIEYSSKEYTLEYKITEYQGQRDTVYVLIPKETYKED